LKRLKRLKIETLLEHKPSAGHGDAPAFPQKLVMVFKVLKGAGARPSV
jgi:hypothetical protein